MFSKDTISELLMIEEDKNEEIEKKPFISVIDNK